MSSHVELQAVSDCLDASALGLTLDDLLDETNYQAGQQLAAEALARCSEDIFVRSNAHLGDNVVVFPNQPRPGSSIRVVGDRYELRLWPHPYPSWAHTS